MFVLATKTVEDVSAGYLLAVNTAVTIFGIPAAIVSAMKVYEEIGHQLGASYYNYMHPDQLGDMYFTASDFL